MGKLLYGALFVVLLPGALVAWAHATSGAVGLHTPRWPVIGWALAGAGVAIMLEAMRELWFRGGGLPMNAYPPVRVVTSGVYGVLGHPIYVGFCAACAGVAIAMGSSGGLWLVTPAVIAGCSALVVGYEGPALRARFGSALPQPLLRRPEAGDGPPSLRDRAVVYVLLFAPWVVLYEGWGHVQPDGLMTPLLPGERGWPAIEWTTYGYSLAYPFTMCVPLVLRRRQDVRKFFDAGIAALVLMMLVYVVCPARSLPRAFDLRAMGGWLLDMERSDGLSGAVALPSYHVVWVLLAASALSRMGTAWGVFAWVAAVGISVTCITTGMHSVVDVAAAVPIVILAWHAPRAWALLVRGCERIANSWSCVRVGPVRVINYAAYAGAAAGVGMFLWIGLAGLQEGWRLCVVALIALLAAAIWGQVLVGSPTLLRPFGYFGSLLGAAGGLAWIRLAQGHSEFWLVAGALAASAPWIVVIGRLRCLVQGCCHGKPVNAGPGIRYRHPLSRVCRIAHLDGVAVHPTPLYSMVINAAIGLGLARLWWVGAPLSMIAGVYLLAAGAGRFVEESRRGEPQTQMFGGLRIYQWCAVASIVCGSCITALGSPGAPGTIAVTWTAAAWSVTVAFVYAAVMGADFPESKRRFSRLA